MSTINEALLVETHGGSDDVVARWPIRQTIVVTHDKVQIDGAVVALYEDRHYYPTRDPRNPSYDTLDGDKAGNAIWIDVSR